MIAVIAEIVPLAEVHFDGLRQTLNIVAREKRYLVFDKAPPTEQAFFFYRNIVANDFCHYVVLLNSEVSGWCDILPTHGELRSHVGTLGMGLVPGARHKGIGRMLIQTTLEKAWAKGFLRIELTVRADNLNAIALYERTGFKQEGTNRRAMLVDGEFYDTYSMALLRDHYAKD